MRHPRSLFQWLLFLCGVSCLTATAETVVHRTTIPPDFYQVIITNNLFRPLGWKKPTTDPTIELIATVIKPNGNHKALLRSTKTKKIYYVTIGDHLENAEVRSIENYRITLKEGWRLKAYRLSF